VELGRVGAQVVDNSSIVCNIRSAATSAFGQTTHRAGRRRSQTKIAPSLNMTYPAPPPPFLRVVVHDVQTSPPVAALCAGYETGDWRAKGLADHLMEWLPEFALSAEELRDFHSGSGLRLIRKAAQLVYQTDKYKLRGEFGEMFLHLVLRQLYKSIPAISKIYWKDAVNSTVKGFDAVHVVETSGKLELWLGEVKFYENITAAISEVAEELGQHTASDYLKNEFTLITNKLDKDATHYDRLAKLLDPNTSLDEVFDAACVPVLLTYESVTIKGHKKVDAAYLAAIKSEVDDILSKFAGKVSALNLPIKVHLFLIPLGSKAKLVELLDRGLKGLQ
jgi:hypothetical protein